MITIIVITGIGFLSGVIETFLKKSGNETGARNVSMVAYFLVTLIVLTLVGQLNNSLMGFANSQNKSMTIDIESPIVEKVKSVIIGD